MAIMEGSENVVMVVLNSTLPSYATPPNALYKSIADALIAQNMFNEFNPRSLSLITR
jgi:hypothetical protein